jgi:hypothetical protein
VSYFILSRDKRITQQQRRRIAIGFSSLFSPIELIIVLVSSSFIRPENDHPLWETTEKSEEEQQNKIKEVCRTKFKKKKVTNHGPTRL